MTTPKWLEAAAARSATETWTLGYTLAEYHLKPSLTPEAVAAELGCTLKPLQSLYLCCRHQGPGFAQQLTTIIAPFPASAEKLEAVLYQVAGGASPLAGPTYWGSHRNRAGTLHGWRSALPLHTLEGKAHVIACAAASRARTAGCLHDNSRALTLVSRGRTLMAGGVNKVILIGNLGADPEVRFTPGGQAVANFRIATSDTWTDKQGQKQERTEWHRIVVWGKLAELCGEYLKKGRQCYVEGRLQTREWTDKEGRKNYTTEVVALGVTFLGPRPDGDQADTGSPPQGGEPPPDDDIPF